MCRNGTQDCPGTTFYNRGLFGCSDIGCVCVGPPPPPLMLLGWKLFKLETCYVDQIYVILWESLGPKLPYFLKYRQYFAHLLPEVGHPIIIVHKVKQGYFQKT